MKTIKIDNETYYQLKAAAKTIREDGDISNFLWNTLQDMVAAMDDEDSAKYERELKRLQKQ